MILDVVWAFKKLFGYFVCFSSWNLVPNYVNTYVNHTYTNPTTFILKIVIPTVLVLTHVSANVMADIIAIVVITAIITILVLISFAVYFFWFSRLFFVSTLKYLLVDIFCFEILKFFVIVWVVMGFQFCHFFEDCMCTLL